MVIDAHAHFVPPQLVELLGKEYCIEEGTNNRSLIRTPRSTVPVKNDIFDINKIRESMTCQGIDRKVLCLPPFLLGLEKTGNEAKEWMRNANGIFQEITDGFNGAFSAFGILCLKNIEACVQEIECNTAKGIIGFELPTNIDGMDLCDDQFSEVFEILNEKQMPILIHPTSARMGNCLKQFYFSNLLGNPFETAIVGANMLVSGFFSKYPNIRILLSHGGGALPGILGRIGHRYPELCDLKGNIAIPDTMYFDTVVFEEEVLRYLVNRTHNVVLGSDSPFDMEEDNPFGFIKKSLLAEEVNEILVNTERRFLNLI